MEYHLSIVIPVYNEETRIGGSLEKIKAYLAKQVYTREIILVDDGSRDGGIELARRLLEGYETYRVVEYGGNRGKGYALQQGILATQGRYVLFTDADLSTPIEELDKFWPCLEEGFEVVQGSRKMRGALVERRQPWWRQKMGEVFTWLSNVLVVGDISDVTCGFKAYQGEIARQLYGTARLADWSFDAEIIFIARKAGYKIKEIPVRWHDERGTKVRIVRDAARSLRGLVSIRLNGWQGRYRVDPATVNSWQLAVGRSDREIDKL